MKHIESRMKISCLEIEKKSFKFTNDELEKFRINPTHNPRTGRKISVSGNIYKQLETQLNQKDNIDVLVNIPPKLIVKKLKPRPLSNLQNKNL